MTLLSESELTEEVRAFEAFGEPISDDAAATIAWNWHSIATPQLTMLATHVNPFTDSSFELSKLADEARLEHRLAQVAHAYSERDKAWATRQFEALYFWIGVKQSDIWTATAYYGR